MRKNPQQVYNLLAFFEIHRAVFPQDEAMETGHLPRSSQVLQHSSRRFRRATDDGMDEGRYHRFPIDLRFLYRISHSHRYVQSLYNVFGYEIIGSSINKLSCSLSWVCCRWRLKGSKAERNKRRRRYEKHAYFQLGRHSLHRDRYSACF